MGCGDFAVGGLGQTKPIIVIINDLLVGEGIWVFLGFGGWCMFGRRSRIFGRRHFDCGSVRRACDVAGCAPGLLVAGRGNYSLRASDDAVVTGGLGGPSTGSAA